MQNVAEMQERHQEELTEREEAIVEKDHKMVIMGREFEKSLNDVAHRMTEKLNALAKRWDESEKVSLSEDSKKRLADFHLNKIAWD